MSEPKVGALILAAGRASRMGANKLAAGLAGKAVIAHVADAVFAAVLPPPIVVLGHDPEPVRAALAGRPVRFLTAPDHQEGIARSIASGIAAIPGWDAVIICLGDMPFLSPALLRALGAKASSETIIIPTAEGRRGNPVLWGSDHFPRLMALRGDTGARSLFDALAEHIVELAWEGPEAVLDIDTPGDLTAARTMLNR